MKEYILKCLLVIGFSLLLMFISIGFIVLFPYVAYKSRTFSNKIIIMEGWTFEYK